jgi:hypothetical protein
MNRMIQLEMRELAKMLLIAALLGFAFGLLLAWATGVGNAPPHPLSPVEYVPGIGEKTA